MDDGSSDNTKEILKKYSILLICHPVRKGYGASIKDGVNIADGNLICIIDADGTYLPADILSLLDNVNDCDMVVGSRTKSGGASFPLTYKVSKFFICSVLSLIFRQKVLDINSGLRIMKKNILIKYRSILPEGFSLTATITFAMMLDGYKIKYVPVDYHERTGKSKIKRLSYTFNFIKSYLRILLYKFRHR